MVAFCGPGIISREPRLGRAIEPLLEGAKALALRRAGATRRISDLIGFVDSEEGRLRVAEHLAAEPYPHYEADPDHPGLLVRIEADGTRTPGRFVNREFRAAE